MTTADSGTIPVSGLSTVVSVVETNTASESFSGETLTSTSVDMNHDMDMDMNMSMAMFFTTSFTSPFLFKKWEIESISDKVLVCIGTFLLAFLYELAKDLRALWNRGFFSGKLELQSFNDGPDIGDCCADGEDNFSTFESGFWLRHFVQSFLHIIQVLVAFVLMLIAMSFNYYLLVSICVGNGLGYFLAGIIRQGVRSEMKRKIKRKRKRMEQERERDESQESFEEEEEDSRHYQDYYNTPSSNENQMQSRIQNGKPNQNIMRATPFVYDNYANTKFNY